MAVEALRREAQGRLGDPTLALDGLGHAVALWRQEGGRGVVTTSRYVVGTGWGSLRLLDAALTRETGILALARDGTGAALAVWE
jgi:hypothetical protein